MEGPIKPERRKPMAIAKVIEVLAQSEKGWEDAAQEALRQASKTVRKIETIYIKDLQAVVKNEEIVQYRVNAKITFLVED
jgi:flavin-binding protein dodecin